LPCHGRVLVHSSAADALCCAPGSAACAEIECNSWGVDGCAALLHHYFAWAYGGTSTCAFAAAYGFQGVLLLLLVGAVGANCLPAWLSRGLAVTGVDERGSR
jgi:hypothetical protein